MLERGDCGRKRGGVVVDFCERGGRGGRGERLDVDCCFV